MKELKYGNYYYCKTIRRLDWLRNRGFIPFKTQTNLTNPKLLVWVFENSLELEKALEEFEKQIPVNR